MKSRAPLVAWLPASIVVGLLVLLLVALVVLT